ncbi:hypothetical protein J2R80_008047 [Bradyrhizobium sp. USDA 4541]|nr:hypothetical protein [Bradyrhizobium sp. USDA 4541]
MRSPPWYAGGSAIGLSATDAYRQPLAGDVGTMILNRYGCKELAAAQNSSLDRFFVGLRVGGGKTGGGGYFSTCIIT